MVDVYAIASRSSGIGIARHPGATVDLNDARQQGRAIDVTESEVVRRGQRMPEIAAQGLDGKEWTLSAGTGKVRLLDFWATWCGPCLQALPTVAALHEELGSKG